MKAWLGPGPGLALSTLHTGLSCSHQQPQKQALLFYTQESGGEAVTWLPGLLIEGCVETTIQAPSSRHAPK